MVFGRAGEEITSLQEQGIPVDIVPGITAASAMASRLGVSLTHRDHAQGVRFVTGHSRKGSLPDNLDWTSLADKNMTTIYYMAGRTAGEIAERLINAGMTAGMPTAIVSSLTRPNEQRWHGALRDLGQAVEDIGLDEPILIGVGAVFGNAAVAARGDHSIFRVSERSQVTADRR